MHRLQARKQTSARSLVLLFAGLFAVEGLCALTGLQRLPFDYYGKDVAGWSATHLASLHALLALPWALKPIYGALSDNCLSSGRDVARTSSSRARSPPRRVSCSG